MIIFNFTIQCTVSDPLQHLTQKMLECQQRFLDFTANPKYQKDLINSLNDTIQQTIQILNQIDKLFGNNGEFMQKKITDPVEKAQMMQLFSSMNFDIELYKVLLEFITKIFHNQIDLQNIQILDYVMDKLPNQDRDPRYVGEMTRIIFFGILNNIIIPKTNFIDLLLKQIANTDLRTEIKKDSDEINMILGQLKLFYQQLAPILQNITNDDE